MSNEKELAIVFADICGSTSLFERHGDVLARKLVTNAISLLTDLMSRNSGTLIKTIGDEIMCTFPSSGQALSFGEGIPSIINSDNELLEHGISVRMGVHIGSVIEKDNDIHGAAVNIAARMAGIAKSGEIIATKKLVTSLPKNKQANASFLNKIKIKGKHDEIEVYQIAREDDFPDLTATYISSQSKTATSICDTSLILKYNGQEYKIDKESKSIHIGRSKDNDIVVIDESTSRKHAKIEHRMGKFILHDHSKHGTAIHTDSGRTIWAHREEIMLYDKGKIAMGKISLKDKPALIEYIVTN